MATNKRPRQYAEAIMHLPYEERAVALASVPQHFRSIVESHVDIAESMEKREIEKTAQRIAGLESRDARAAALKAVATPIRDRVRARAIELFTSAKQEKANAE